MWELCEFVEGGGIHMHVGLSVHVCSLTKLWRGDDVLSHYLLASDRFRECFFFFVLSQFTPASVQNHLRLFSGSHSARKGFRFYTETLFSWTPKLQWFFSIINFFFFFFRCLLHFTLKANKWVFVFNKLKMQTLFFPIILLLFF